MNIFVRLLAEPCASVGLVVGVVFLAVGLLGRPRGTRPMCRACRAPLGGSVELPKRCPACQGPLDGRGAVRFGGYRLGWRAVVFGVLLMVLPMVPVWIAGTPPAVPPLAMTIPIERNVGQARFAEATADADAGAWLWIRAHLEAGELSPALRRQAAALAIESARAGHISGDFDAALGALGDLVDEEALATALVEAVPMPTVKATYQRGSGIRVAVEWADEGALHMAHEAPYHRVYAIVRTTVAGQVVRPFTPMGRAAILPRQTGTHLRPPVELTPDDGTTVVSVELEVAVMREPSDDFETSRIVGPPSMWEGVLARRTLTIETVVEPE